jgi:hypothetical protein
MKLAACSTEMFQYSPGRIKESTRISSGSLCPVKIQPVHLTNTQTTYLNWPCFHIEHINDRNGYLFCLITGWCTSEIWTSKWFKAFYFLFSHLNFAEFMYLLTKVSGGFPHWGKASQCVSYIHTYIHNVFIFNDTHTKSI